MFWVYVCRRMIERKEDENADSEEDERMATEGWYKLTISDNF